MLPIRWQPRSVWPEMSRLQDEMDHLFGQRNGLRHFGRWAYPPVCLWEHDDNLYVEAELPGYELGELEITLGGENQLSIKGERKQPELVDATWHRQERGYGSFNRLIELPEHVDPDKVAAEFKHGVLTVIMPKKEEAKARRIEVKCN